MWSCIFKGGKMQIYQCPNCGRTYTEFDNKFYCGTCNYKLLKKEDIKKIKNPHLTNREYKIIGTVNNSESVIECPYCHSKNTKKITITSKALHTAIFGIFSMNRNSKQWHCNNCNSDF